MTFNKLSSAIGRALAVSVVLLLAFGGGDQRRPVFAEAGSSCSSKNNSNSCKNGCVWEDGACYDEGSEPSASNPGGSPGGTPAGSPATSSPTAPTTSAPTCKSHSFSSFSI